MPGSTSCAIRGPIVIGASQGAACFGAAYEFSLQSALPGLKKHHLLDKVPLTYVTAEPFLGHFGIGGLGNAQWMSGEVLPPCTGHQLAYRCHGERSAAGWRGAWQRRDAALEVHDDHPRFLGIDADPQYTRRWATPTGFIETDDGYRHKQYPEVYAAGVAVFVPPVGETAVP